MSRNRVKIRAPESFTQDEYLKLVNDWHNNPPHQEKKKNIAIVGAGMAGLTCAWLLHLAGHKIRIYEANNIPGGRVKTLRDGFTEGLYAEAGAMRIPERHKLALDFVKRFVNEKDESQKREGDELWNFVNESRKTLFFINGEKMKREEADKDQMRSLKFLGENDVDSASEMNSDEILESCLVNYIRKECNLPSFSMEEIDENSSKPDDLIKYHKIRSKLDGLSLRQFLSEAYLTVGGKPQKLSAAARDFVLLLESFESLLSASMTAILDDIIALKSEKYFQIRHGMDRLPKALARKLSNDIRYNERVVEIDAQPPGDKEGVLVKYENRITKMENKRLFDLVVLAIPFTALRHVRTSGFVDPKKHRAIRQLHYDNACKIVLEFSKPFWVSDGVEGGTSITDLPIRRIFYPVKEQLDRGGAGGTRCLLLASYTWGADSARWTSLNQDERIRQALYDVAKVHRLPLDSICIGGMTHSWEQDEFVCGAFALFEPSQLVDLFQDVWRPSGRFHFCGEHTSLKHGWIEGAIESGIRCADEICHRVSKNDSLGSKLEISANPYAS